MGEDGAMRDLMTRLMEAVEASITGSDAVREALADLAREGYEPRLFFVANAESGDDEPSAGPGPSAEGDEAADPDEGDDGRDPTDGEGWLVREFGTTAEVGPPALELTRRDRDFLRSVHIRPESD